MTSSIFYHITESVDAVDPNNVHAILRYAGAPDADPTTDPNRSVSGTLLEEQNLHVRTSLPCVIFI